MVLNIFIGDILTMQKAYTKLWVGLLGLMSLGLHAQNINPEVNAFLKSLTPELREKATFNFNDDERFNWHYVPRSRKGVKVQELNKEQQQAMMNLLKASLSEQGFKKANSIMQLESILREIEGRPVTDNYRNPANYSISVFGEPSSQIWGWRLEGHHVSLNFSSIDGSIASATPSFLGSNPAIVPSGSHQGEQILNRETNLGLEFVNSLNEEQLRTAWISKTAPSEIITANSQSAENILPKGILYTDLNQHQQQIFLALLDVYVSNYAFGFSSTLKKKIEDAGIENLSFAWAGSLSHDSGTYYRIQGPMLLIEYDNTQNNANHIHSVTRDLNNDFAKDILREHYANEHDQN